MKLNKNTQIILGVGALAVVGYFVWKNNKSDKKNASGLTINITQRQVKCPPSPDKDWTIVGNYNGGSLYQDKYKVYHWYETVKNNKTQTIDCYENQSTSNPLIYAPLPPKK